MSTSTSRISRRRAALFCNCEQQEHRLCIAAAAAAAHRRSTTELPSAIATSTFDASKCAGRARAQASTSSDTHQEHRLWIGAKLRHNCTARSSWSARSRRAAAAAAAAASAQRPSTRPHAPAPSPQTRTAVECTTTERDRRHCRSRFHMYLRNLVIVTSSSFR